MKMVDDHSALLPSEWFLAREKELEAQDLFIRQTQVQIDRLCRAQFLRRQQQQQQQQYNLEDNNQFYGYYVTKEETIDINSSNNDIITSNLRFGQNDVGVGAQQLSQQRKRKKKKKQSSRCQKGRDSAFSVVEKQPNKLQLESAKASARYRLKRCCASNNFGRDVNLITVVKSCKSFSNSMRVCVHTSGRYLCWWRVRFKPFSNTFRPLPSGRVVSQRRHVFAHLKRLHSQQRTHTHHHKQHHQNIIGNHLYQRQRTHTHRHQQHHYTHITQQNALQSSSSFKQRSLGSCKAGPAAFVQRSRASVLRSFQWWRHRIKNHPSTFALIISHSGIKHKRHHITLIIAFFIHSKGNQKLGGKL